MTAEQPERLDGVDGLCHSIANSEMTQLPQIRTGPERRGVPGRRKVRPDPAERAHDAVPQPIAHTQRVSPTTKRSKQNPGKCAARSVQTRMPPHVERSLCQVLRIFWPGDESRSNLPRIRHRIKCVNKASLPRHPRLRFRAEHGRLCHSKQLRRHASRWRVPQAPELESSKRLRQLPGPPASASRHSGKIG